MSTAAKPQTRTQAISIAPAPCRMIRIEVYDDIDKAKELWGIAWSHVIGIACGRMRGIPGSVDVWPVLAGSHPEDGELCVADDNHDCANVKYKAVVPCFWPPEEDRLNATRIGKELIEKDGEIGNWVSMPKEPRRGEH